MDKKDVVVNTQETQMYMEERVQKGFKSAA